MPMSFSGPPTDGAYMKLWNLDFQSVCPAELHSADNEQQQTECLLGAQGRRPMFPAQ